MSRSGYSDECEYYELWRGTVRRALGGKRGQQALREIAEAMDAMPEKRLVAHSFSCSEGVCTLGALAQARGVDVSDLESEPDDFYTEEVDRRIVGRRFNIAPAMAAEVMFMNDEASGTVETPEQRWSRMRDWVARHLRGEGQ